jgi:hypothetical protein
LNFQHRLSGPIDLYIFPPWQPSVFLALLYLVHRSQDDLIYMLDYMRNAACMYLQAKASVAAAAMAVVVAEAAEQSKTWVAVVILLLKM